MAETKPTRTRPITTRVSGSVAARSDVPTDLRLKSALVELERRATKATRDGMARYAIPSDRAFGVSMSGIQSLARELGRDHDLALALWDSGWYEARLMSAYVDDPAAVTSAQTDRWCRDFDRWALCDTVCRKLSM